MSALEHLSEALASAVQLAGEGVVRVEGRRRIPSSGIVWNADGLVITAHHTIDRRSEVRVGLPNGEAATAKLLGRDPATDLAVLRMSATGARVLNRSEAGEVKVGHLALALGRPGDAVQATFGIVSAIEAGWRSPLGGHVEQFLQSDVVMYPGFSGGPLIDAWGKVIGMNTSALVRGIALAIPVATIERVSQALVEHGRIRRGFLGVGVQPARLPQAMEDPSGQATGLLVASVEAGGPAQKGGILLGDVLLSLGGERLAAMEDLLAALGGDVVGKATPVEILRGGKRTTLNVTIGERPAPTEEED
jgi:S1-C subfamily serine protease